jgi:hypothetical protein
MKIESDNSNHDRDKDNFIARHYDKDNDHERRTTEHKKH